MYIFVIFQWYLFESAQNRWEIMKWLNFKELTVKPSPPSLPSTEHNSPLKQRTMHIGKMFYTWDRIQS